MRIAFITYEYPPDTGKGGIGTYTVQMAQMLASQHSEVHVIAGSTTRNQVTIEDNVHVHRILTLGPASFNERVLPYFEVLHAASPFDCIESPEIHAHAGAIKMQFPALPLIVRIHAPNQLVEQIKKHYVSFYQKFRFFLGALRRGKWDLGYWRPYKHLVDPEYQFLQLADHIWAPSAIMQQWISLHWNIPSAQIKVIPNPIIINHQFLPPATPVTQNTILFFGRLNVLKGMVTITKAMKYILLANPGWTWLVVGNDGAGPDGKGSMKEWMRAQLKPVESRVVFREGVSHENIPEFLHQSKIVIIPSLFESFSYVCAEAMMAGKAIVGSKGTGIEALLEDGKAGLLADPFKYPEWINCIQLLIDDPALFRQLSSNANEVLQQRAKDAPLLADHYYLVTSKKNKEAVCV